MSPHLTERDLIPVFRRAAEVVNTRGLNQGSYYAGENARAAATPTCPVDAVGALSVAVTGHPVPAEDIDPLLRNAINAFASKVYATTSDPDPVERIASWSDAIGRGPAEVRAAFLAVADVLAREHYALVPVGVRTSDGSVWRLTTTDSSVPRYVLAGMPADAPIGVQVELSELVARFGTPSACSQAVVLVDLLQQNPTLPLASWSISQPTGALTGNLGRTGFDALRAYAEVLGGSISPGTEFTAEDGTRLRTHRLRTVWQGVPVTVSIYRPAPVVSEAAA